MLENLSFVGRRLKPNTLCLVTLVHTVNVYTETHDTQHHGRMVQCSLHSCSVKVEQHLCPVTNLIRTPSARSGMNSFLAISPPHTHTFSQQCGQQQKSLSGVITSNECIQWGAVMNHMMPKRPLAAFKWNWPGSWLRRQKWAQFAFPFKWLKRFLEKDLFDVDFFWTPLSRSVGL